MKVMVFVQMDPKDETGAMPSEELLAAMGAYNEELVKAGIMLDVGGLMPTSAGICAFSLSSRCWEARFRIST